jgi:hypothetical protein
MKQIKSVFYLALTIVDARLRQSIGRRRHLKPAQRGDHRRGDLRSIDTSRASTSTSSLLPASMYFLANDGIGLSQVYRLESDGTTVTQLTFEPPKCGV